jgi:hypothetical protein
VRLVAFQRSAESLASDSRPPEQLSSANLVAQVHRIRLILASPLMMTQAAPLRRALRKRLDGLEYTARSKRIDLTMVLDQDAFGYPLRGADPVATRAFLERWIADKGEDEVEDHLLTRILETPFVSADADYAALDWMAIYRQFQLISKENEAAVEAIEELGWKLLEAEIQRSRDIVQGIMQRYGLIASSGGDPTTALAELGKAAGILSERAYAVLDAFVSFRQAERIYRRNKHDDELQRTYREPDASSVQDADGSSKSNYETARTDYHDRRRAFLELTTLLGTVHPLLHAIVDRAAMKERWATIGSDLDRLNGPGAAAQIFQTLGPISEATDDLQEGFEDQDSDMSVWHVRKLEAKARELLGIKPGSMLDRVVQDKVEHEAPSWIGEALVTVGLVVMAVLLAPETGGTSLGLILVEVAGVTYDVVSIVNTIEGYQDKQALHRSSIRLAEALEIHEPSLFGLLPEILFGFMGLHGAGRTMKGVFSTAAEAPEAALRAIRQAQGLADELGRVRLALSAAETERSAMQAIDDLANRVFSLEHVLGRTEAERLWNASLEAAAENATEPARRQIRRALGEAADTTPVGRVERPFEGGADPRGPHAPTPHLPARVHGDERLLPENVPKPWAPSQPSWFMESVLGGELSDTMRATLANLGYRTVGEGSAARFIPREGFEHLPLLKLSGAKNPRLAHDGYLAAVPPSRQMVPSGTSVPYAGPKSLAPTPAGTLGAAWDAQVDRIVKAFQDAEIELNPTTLGKYLRSELNTGVGEPFRALWEGLAQMRREGVSRPDALYDRLMGRAGAPSLKEADLARIYDDMSYEELLVYFLANGSRKYLQGRRRGTGGMHEYFPVEFTWKFKKWGATWEQLQAATVSTQRARSSISQHVTAGHPAGFNTKLFHAKIEELVLSSHSLQDYVGKLKKWMAAWSVDAPPLPGD